jgi:hypothetical protein
MRVTAVALGAALVGVRLVMPATAAVNESEFPPKTVADLVAICNVSKDDPLMTASVNYCHGFIEAAVIVEEAHSSQHHARHLFCLPSPPPARSAAITDFTVWANEKSSRLDQPAIDGIFLYFAIKYPCGKKM